MTDISLRNVRKSYGAVPVLHGVDLDVAAGEFVVLVGPSGCGKSTLLRMIAGLERITDGDLLIEGRRMNDVPPKDRDIAMVFQSYALYPHLTVEENMAFSLRLRGVARDEKAARVRDAARVLGLGELLSRYPKELSGGQRQRVAMGRAIVRDPKVFLFDEPLSNLDAKLRVNTRAEIKMLQKRLGTTTVYVTHDQIEAMTMGDRIVVMNGGRVEQIGHPLEVYDRPANLFVAGFLGSPAMNFLRGAYDPDAGAFTLPDGTRLDLPQARWRHSGEAILGIRPEHVVLARDGTPARLELDEPTGADTHVTLAIGGQTLVAVLHERIAATIGDTLAIGLLPGRAQLFDPGAGTRLPSITA